MKTTNKPATMTVIFADGSIGTYADVIESYPIGAKRPLAKALKWKGEKLATASNWVLHFAADDLGISEKLELADVAAVLLPVQVPAVWYTRTRQDLAHYDGKASRYFTRAFLGVYLRMLEIEKFCMDNDIDDEFRDENGYIAHHAGDEIRKTDFYNKASGNYCCFLEVAHGLFAGRIFNA